MTATSEHTFDKALREDSEYVANGLRVTERSVRRGAFDLAETVGPERLLSIFSPKNMDAMMDSFFPSERAPHFRDVQAPTYIPVYTNNFPSEPVRSPSRTPPRARTPPPPPHSAARPPSPSPSKGPPSPSPAARRPVERSKPELAASSSFKNLLPSLPFPPSAAPAAASSAKFDQRRAYTTNIPSFVARERVGVLSPPRVVSPARMAYPVQHSAGAYAAQYSPVPAFGSHYPPAFGSQYQYPPTQYPLGTQFPQAAPATYFPSPTANAVPVAPSRPQGSMMM